ncbi:unnamed protein product [Rhizophagus irregularis]|nr:unnamed protein product [Rhizophagus irregularis]
MNSKTLTFRLLILSNSQNLDYVWRIIIGVGIIPATIALYFRLTIPETPRFTIDVQGNVDKAAHNIKFALEQDFIHHFGQWENGKVLLGTSVTWFAHDVAYYGIGLNNAIILEAICYVKTEDAYQSLFNISVGNIVITLMGTIPGYWFTVFLVDSLGRKYIQLQGFALLTIIFIIMGFGEVFPTRYRSTCHGISAASGKLGAIISQFVFLKLKDIGGKNQSVNHLFKFFGFFTFIGFLFTLLIPETKGLTLEELSNEKKIIHIDKDTKDIIIDDPTILSSRSIRKSRAWYEEDDDFSDAS